MSKILIAHGGETMPNRLVPGSQKDKSYDLAMARYSLSTVDATAIDEQWEKYVRNRRYYGAKQWFESEDIDFFLKDKYGNERKRIQVVMNMIRPIVEQYRGAMSQAEFNFKVEPLSTSARTRREEFIHTAVNISRIVQSRKGTVTAQALQEMTGVSDDPVETEQFAEENYADPVARAVTEIIKMVFAKDRLHRQAERMIFETVIGGITGVAPYMSGGHVYYRPVSPRDLIWDTSVDDGDRFFENAEFQGVCPYMTVSQIAETWGLKRGDDRLAVLDQIKRDRMNSAVSYGYSYDQANMSTNPRVYSVYYKDYDYKEHAYFKDPATGMPILREIGSQSPTGETYTKDKAIDPPDNEVVRRVFGSEKIAEMTIEEIRYCDFVPREWGMNTTYGSGEYYGRAGNDGDIVLSHGKYQLEEANAYDTSKVELPIKMGAYALEDGHVLSPIDDAIDPQRLANRFLSAQESIINESGGQSVVYDKDMIAGIPGGEAAFNKAIKDGEAIGINAGGRGIQNAVQVHDMTPKAGVFGMFQLVQQMQEIIRTSTGIHEPLVGQPTGGDQYVGTTQMLMQRGAIMQRPVFDTVNVVLEMVAQHIATAGRVFYIDNPTNLFDMVSSDVIEPLLLTEESRLEQYRAFVKRVDSEQALRQEADAWLQALAGSIFNEEDLGELLGRSTLEDVRKHLKRKAAQLRRAQAQQAEMMAAQQEAAGLAMQQEQMNAERQDIEDKEFQAAQEREDRENKKELAVLNKRGEIAKAQVSKP